MNTIKMHEMADLKYDGEPIVGRIESSNGACYDGVELHGLHDDGRVAGLIAVKHTGERCEYGTMWRSSYIAVTGIKLEAGERLPQKHIDRVTTYLGFSEAAKRLYAKMDWSVTNLVNNYDVEY